ncbi:hypothetical protein BH11VER1_BH11VER1_08970 [soil metagenome]
MFFAKNTRRKANVARGNYPFRSKRRVTRLEVRRLELNPETSATRRETRRKTARVGFKFSVMILFAMGLFSAGKIVVMEAFVENPRFHLQHFSVITEGELTPAQIIASSGLKEGVNLLGVSLVQVRENLEALPQVKEAKVSRGYPGILFMEVKQRRPVAWLEQTKDEGDQSNLGKSFLLDEEGCVLPGTKLTDVQRRLPVIALGQSCQLVLGQRIESSQALDALRLLKSSEACAVEKMRPIKRIELTKNYALTALYASQMEVVFSMDNMEKQLARLERILKEAALQKWQIATVDLMVQHNVPITLKDGVPANDEPQITEASEKRPPVQNRSLAKIR